MYIIALLCTKSTIRRREQNILPQWCGKQGKIKPKALSPCSTLPYQHGAISNLFLYLHLLPLAQFCSSPIHHTHSNVWGFVNNTELRNRVTVPLQFQYYKAINNEKFKKHILYYCEEKFINTKYYFVSV